MSLPGILSTARGFADTWRLTHTLIFMSTLATSQQERRPVTSKIAKRFRRLAARYLRDINVPDELYTKVQGGSTGGFAISRTKQKMAKVRGCSCDNRPFDLFNDAKTYGPHAELYFLLLRSMSRETPFSFTRLVDVRLPAGNDPLALPWSCERP